MVCTTKELEFDFRQGQDTFLFSTESKSWLQGPPSLLFSGYQGLFFPGLKRPGREVYH
jgi:hypothetical protein